MDGTAEVNTLGASCSRNTGGTGNESSARPSTGSAPAARGMVDLNLERRYAYAMRNTTVTKLSKPVRTFLARARKGRGLVVEDASGRGWVGVVPYDESSRRAQEAAMKRLERIQKKVGRVMRAKGKTEEDFDRLLQDG